MVERRKEGLDLSQPSPNCAPLFYLTARTVNYIKEGKLFRPSPTPPPPVVGVVSGVLCERGREWSSRSCYSKRAKIKKKSHLQIISIPKHPHS
jgi:hypothetical protein